MPRQNPSRRIYLGLVLVLILLMVASVFFPAMKGLPDPSADLSRSELLLLTVGQYKHRQVAGADPSRS